MKSMSFEDGSYDLVVVMLAVRAVFVMIVVPAGVPLITETGNYSA